MSDSLVDGIKFRLFNVIDDYNRVTQANEVDTSFAISGRGSERLNAIEQRRKPVISG